MNALDKILPTTGGSQMKVGGMALDGGEGKKPRQRGAASHTAHTESGWPYSPASRVGCGSYDTEGSTFSWQEHALY